MNYFLAKTDPETYSIDDLERDKKTVWDGVTNPTAVRAIKEMRMTGDRVFIYHSMGAPAVVGLATVRADGRVDPRTRNRRWRISSIAGKAGPADNARRNQTVEKI